MYWTGTYYYVAVMAATNISDFEFEIKHVSAMLHTIKTEELVQRLCALVCIVLHF